MHNWYISPPPEHYFLNWWCKARLAAHAITKKLVPFLESKQPNLMKPYALHNQPTNLPTNQDCDGGGINSSHLSPTRQNLMYFLGFLLLSMSRFHFYVGGWDDDGLTEGSIPILISCGPLCGMCFGSSYGYAICYFEFVCIMLLSAKGIGLIYDSIFLIMLH